MQSLAQQRWGRAAELSGGHAWRSGGAPLGAFVALGAVLRFATLDVQSFWRDEALTVSELGGSLGDALRDVAHQEATPPLYYVLAWLWTRVAGTGEVGIRSLSALIGTLAIPVAFAIGARLGGRTAGLIAAALVAFNPFLIWFSQEARSYALLVLLCAIATLQWLRAMTEGDRRAAVWWGVAGALALLTHYFAAFLLVPQAAMLLWRSAAGRRAALGGIAIVGAVGLALVPLGLTQRDTRVDWVGETGLRVRALDVPKHWLAGPFGSPIDAAVAVVAVVLVAGAALALTRRRPLLVAVAAVAGAALPLALAAAGADYVLDRYLMASLIPFLAVAATGLATFPAGRFAAALAGGLFVAFTLNCALDPKLQREDWRAAARDVEGSGVATAVVTPPEGDTALRLYLPGARVAGGEVPVRDVVYVAPWRFGQPRPPDPPPPAPGFRRVERADEPTTTLVRYRAPTEVAVDPGALATHVLRKGGATVLVTGRAAPRL